MSIAILVQGCLQLPGFFSHPPLPRVEDGLLSPGGVRVPSVRSRQGVSFCLASCWHVTRVLVRSPAPGRARRLIYHTVPSVRSRRGVVCRLASCWHFRLLLRRALPLWVVSCFFGALSRSGSRLKFPARRRAGALACFFGALSRSGSRLASSVRSPDLGRA